ncbi:DUF4268 domain-containing protein [Stakelama tenebrarum]|uniref:DUF4268 domain-containing protein n=1 Tax=Stakelama tenebrarum TaxID=2711215 RepID=A0A6G6Y3X1_9SPHN|nr:DUF4268 domain-containing protein [Sphingosinithalassobacter tenebrarum]QIG79644.1 DUF4268 domain-containing protein [Sphingosinithalassobacter tenebrarum]
MTPALGTLHKVDLRTIWLSESSDFTPWLAKAENLSILGETIGIELELEAQEKYVGPFRADILCKDSDNDSWVLIENQLERTDHNHLGQLLTYAAGLQTVTIVWVAAKFTEEHRAALDWLNEITNSRFRFFGLEVELWRIADSMPAPRFNVISKPNDWTRSVERAASQIDSEVLSETKLQQQRYWQGLNQLLEEQGVPLRTRTARPQHWHNFSIGRSKFKLCTKVNSQAHVIGCELFISHVRANDYLELLRADRDAIEADAGLTFDWQELPGRIGTRIEIARENTDFTRESEWPEQHAWLADKLVRMNKAFRHRIAALDLDEIEAAR